jgi:hypothetical protein
MNKPGLKRGFHYDEATSSLGIWVDGVRQMNLPDTLGRTYYVNNITGSSTNDGLSWGSPFAQVSEAISASETYRELGGGAPSVTTNDYIPNYIVIQGTGTAYTGITDLGERCFITGLSAGLMRDGGSGQVRIGASDTDGCDDATNARGNTLYNIQFQGGGDTMYAFRNTAWIQRSRFQDVTFMAAGASLEACFYVTAMSGTIMERCTFADNQGGTKPLYGFTANGQFSDNYITDCIFWAGSTALLHLSNSLQTGSLIANCYFFGPSAIGAYNLASSGSYGTSCFLANCKFAGTDVITDQINWSQTAFLADNWGSGAVITG